MHVARLSGMVVASYCIVRESGCDCISYIIGNGSGTMPFAALCVKADVGGFGSTSRNQVKIFFSW
jgi:hypothetical protein